MGRKTIEMARHYARGADLKPKMRGAVEAFEKSVNERRKLSNPTEELSKLKSRECDLSENRIRINVLFGSGGGTRTPDTRIMMLQIINFKDKQFQQLESVQCTMSRLCRVSDPKRSLAPITPWAPVFTTFATGRGKLVYSHEQTPGRRE